LFVRIVVALQPATRTFVILKNYNQAHGSPPKKGVLGRMGASFFTPFTPHRVGGCPGSKIWGSTYSPSFPEKGNAAFSIPLPRRHGCLLSAGGNHAIISAGKNLMSSKYVFAGLIMIIVGLIEMLVTPLILQHLWVKRPPPHTAYVLRMTRTSGLIVVILGVAFLLGLFG
jgi:hypothetical protein